jgi:hypothetical protein
MFAVNVMIHGKDRKISAMAKALAYEVDGPSSVKGASKEALDRNGFLTFHFSSPSRAKEFRETLAEYLPQILAKVTEESKRQTG